MTPKAPPCSVRIPLVRTLRADKSCRYHRKGEKSRPALTCTPEGICPHAYHAAYPFAFALLYAPDSVRSYRTICPAGKVSLLIRAKPAFPIVLKAWTRLIVRIAGWILRRAVEIPDKIIIIETTAAGKNCPAGLRSGQTFLWNIRDRLTLCPASFYSIYPFLLRSRRSFRAACPDPDGVLYGNPADSFPFPCHRPSWTRGLPIQGPVPVRSLCPTAAYAIRPYLFTLAEGGQFGWVRKGESVLIRCPNPDGVVFSLSGKDRITVLSVRGRCPAGHKTGEVFGIQPLRQKTWTTRRRRSGT